MSEPGKAVFLSYASQDAEAARRIADALRAAGVEVWFDQNELVGGDAWDAKIRKQIKDCALLIPVISANTQARTEGYFRLEWRLADQRTHLMAKGRPFLLPVVIDDTRDTEAHVPDSFTEVQWTKLPGGEGGAPFAARVRKLLADGRDAAPKATSVAPSAAPVRSRTTLIGYGWAAVGIVFALVYAVSSLRREKPRPELPAPVVASVSGAQKLAGQARDQLNLGHRGLASLEAASLLAEEALGLEPTNPEILAIASQVDTRMHFHSLDPSEKRLELARTRAARANQIAPGSFEARLAQATYLVYRPGGPQSEAAGALLGELRTENPRDARVLLLRAAQLMEEGRHEEAFAEYEEMARLPGLLPTALMSKAWDYHRLRQIPEMDVALERSISARPMAGAVALRVHYDLAWLGDLDAALASMQRLPPEELAEDNGISLAVRVHRWRRDPESLLRFLQTVPRSWIKWSVAGPKAALTGEAHAALGRMAAARTDWQQALALVEQRLAEYPSDRANLEWKAWLQASLGLVEAARETYALLRELPEPNRWTLEFERMPRIAPAEDVLADLERRVNQTISALDRKQRVPGNFISAAYLRLNPAWDPLRSHARFVALQARLDADPRFNPNIKPAELPAAKPDDKSVAVLPFANLSGDKEQEYFSDGLTEEILNTLARERDLRVPGRASSFSFKGKNATSAEIARALNVSRLVEGSVRKSGSKVRISVSLTRAADGFSEELGTFTEELSDIFALQDKVARAVVEKLTRRTVAAASVTGTRNPEAYDAYLRGRAVQTRTPRLMNEAMQHYERAVALDPGFALAWARLAEARFRTFTSQADRSPEVVNGSREAIDRALSLQPDLPEALIMRAIWVRRVKGDFTAARRDLDRVESLHPVTADLRHAQAQQAQELGQYADAFRLAREALAIDPQNGDHANAYAISFCATRGEFVEADQMLRRAIVLQGSSSATPFVNLIHVRNLWRGPEAALRLTERWPADQGGRGAARVNLLVRLGRLDEARREFDRLEGQTGLMLQDWSLWFRSDQVDLEILRLLGREDLARNRAREISAEAAKQFARGNRSPLVVADFIRSEIILGHRESALKALEEWRAEAQREPSIQRRNQEFTSSASRLYALLGQVDEAVELLQELQANGHIGRYGLADNPEFASLRGDTRFQEIVRQYEAWRKTLPDPADL